MADDASSDLDQLELQSGQRPFRHGLRQFDTAQDGGQVIGQRVQLQPHLVVAELPAGQPCLAKGIFAFLDVLLGGAALVVEHHDPVWLHWQVGDAEPDTREQLARMPFDLGDHTARFVPGSRLILEVLVEALHLGQRRSSHGPGQPVRDLLSQDFVGWQPDGVEIARLFKVFLQVWHCIGGIGPKNRMMLRFAYRAMTGSRTSRQLSALKTLPLRRAQRSSMPNWLNRKFGW